ncbi:thiol-disulfide isomerase/thioredoxin [Labrenzia sp. EL_208]|nr:thiol-disulfide isomerase/thioredoxin [Labrenzia sp. EL_208]
MRSGKRIAVGELPIQTQGADMIRLNRREILVGSAAVAVAGTPAFAQETDFRSLGLAEPAFTVDAELNIPDLAGKVHQLEDYRGKTVVVSFWATWCPPCRKEMPTLARLGQQLGTDDYAVLAVNIGDRQDKIEAFLGEIEHDGMSILLDNDKEMPAKWFLRGLPVTYIIDPQGKVALGAIGERVWDAPEMISGIRAVGGTT